MVAETDLEPAHPDHRLGERLAVGRGAGGRRRRGAGIARASGQNRTAAKNIAKSPSSTMTMKMDLTTESVTFWPSDSAEPRDREAFDRGDQADHQRHERRLDQADLEGVEADGVLQARR